MSLHTIVQRAKRCCAKCPRNADCSTATLSAALDANSTTTGIAISRTISTSYSFNIAILNSTCAANNDSSALTGIVETLMVPAMVSRFSAPRPSPY